MAASLRSAILIVLPAALLSAFLFLPFRVRVKAALRWQEDGFRILIALRAGLLRFRLRFRPVLIPGRGVLLASEKHGVLRLPKEKPPKKKAKRKRVILAALGAVSVSELRFFGKIGIADDAAACCFLAGASGVILSAALRCAGAILPGSIGLSESIGGIKPVLFENRFDVSVSGIAAAVPAKLTKSLLTGAVGKRKSKKKEKKHAPDRKHHRNLNAADQANDGG
ncbi:MAG: hypothetical protein IJM20_05600 [Clostridia bacterium]|nr:hypothetical protein [Clostridia bacterium]